MSRYNTTKILKRSGEKRKFSTTIIPPMPKSSADTYIKTTSAERLDKLANTFYGDATLWWIIAVSNGLGKGSLYVPPNIIIRIPAHENIQEIINEINISR